MCGYVYKMVIMFFFVFFWENPFKIDQDCATIKDAINLGVTGRYIDTDPGSSKLIHWTLGPGRERKMEGP